MSTSKLKQSDVELEKTDWGYNVNHNGVFVGMLYKEKYSGQDRSFSNCVGYYKAYAQWEFHPQDEDSVYFIKLKRTSRLEWDTFKQAKSKLAFIFAIYNKIIEQN